MCHCMHPRPVLSKLWENKKVQFSIRPQSIRLNMVRFATTTVRTTGFTSDIIIYCLYKPVLYIHIPYLLSLRTYNSGLSIFKLNVILLPTTPCSFVYKPNWHHVTVWSPSTGRRRSQPLDITSLSYAITKQAADDVFELRLMPQLRLDAQVGCDAVMSIQPWLSDKVTVASTVKPKLWKLLDGLKSSWAYQYIPFSFTVDKVISELVLLLDVYWVRARMTLFLPNAPTTTEFVYLGDTAPTNNQSPVHADKKLAEMAAAAEAE